MKKIPSKRDSLHPPSTYWLRFWLKLLLLNPGTIADITHKAQTSLTRTLTKHTEKIWFVFKPQLLQLYSVTPGYKLTPYTSIGKRIVFQGEVGFVIKTVYDPRPPTYLPVPSLYKHHPPNVSSTPPVYQDLA